MEALTMSVRTTFQKVINEFQFRCDMFPNGDYQPLPWIGINKGQRGEGTIERWKAIEASLSGLSIRSGMDIGCNLGYFCFALAQKGVPMLGVDLDSRYIRIAQYTSDKMGLSTVGLFQMVINNETMQLLPKVDLVLLLSVWHHWVRSYGFDEAGHLLSALWEKCERVLFFETGEIEMSADFGLPAMGDSPQKWLEDYLKNICAGAEIQHLGKFKAFAPLGNENRNIVYRNLFKITRLTTG
jgi:SAM-dependent methyltransferase